MEINFDNIPVARQVRKMRILNDHGQLVCACGLPMARKTPEASIVSCAQARCKFSAIVDHVKLMKECGAFKKLPEISLPVCVKCQGAMLMLSKRKEGGRQPTAKCACQSWVMYTYDNDPAGFHDDFWNKQIVIPAKDAAVPAQMLGELL